MLYLLRSKFRRDLIVHFLVVVLVGSALSLAAGYMADNYFGNTVTGLIGDYGEYDVLITVNRETRRSALSQIRDILNAKLPGSTAKQGITIAGKTNFFVSIDEQYKTREHFRKMGSYFNNVTGNIGTTIMSEPRVTLRSIPGELRDEFEKDLGKISGVAFSYPAGANGIDLMLDSPRDYDRVRSEVEDYLNQYQIMQVRFPIDKGPSDVVATGELLSESVKNKYNLEFARNITSNQGDDQQYMVNTMVELKKFLLQYATIINIPVSKDWQVPVGKNDLLAMPGPGRLELKEGQEATPMDLKLEVIEVKDGNVRALITEGNVTDIQTDKIYKIDASNKVKAYLGKGTVRSPREDLKYAADELAKVLPHIDQIFTNLYGMTDEALTAVDVYNQTLGEIEEVQLALQEGQTKVENIRAKLDSVDLTKVQQFITKLVTAARTAEEIATKMEWAQKEIVRIDHELGQFQGQVDIIQEDFGLSGSYARELEQSAKLAEKMQKTIQNNTDLLLGRLNQYNPVLKQISSWKGDLQKLENMVESGELLNANTSSVTATLDRLINSSDKTLKYLDDIDTNAVNKDITGFKESLAKVQEADVKKIISQLKYVSETLPDLRDEEVTKAIKLVERYMSGQVIPGEEVRILVPSGLDVKATESFLMEEVGQSAITVYSMDTGIMQPNIRGEFLRIISEVKETITGIIAIVIVLLILMLDLSGIMSVIKGLRQRKNQSMIMRVLNSELIFGVIMGGLILKAIFRVTNAEIPYIDSHPGLIIGGILGLILALFTDRINPVDRKEYIAGEALGFNLTEILRQIVIPAGKPGFLTILNWRNLIFK